jgi:uncharacterized damage-inducible protein DinB
MNPLLRDLYGHQEWADAEHWRAIDAHPVAAADQATRERLHHINLVQRAFRWIVGDRHAPFTITRLEDFATLGDLKSAAREYHGEIGRFLLALPPRRFDETIEVPWFKDPGLSLTVAEALTQCAMHSQWHRGQNAIRLRELGGEPPPVDLIVWYWKGRPAAAWAR